jgi:hypothetical protein
MLSVNWLLPTQERSMKVEFSEQYSVPCVVIDGTETFDEVETKCSADEALFFDGEEYCMVVQFPGRPMELYTGEALRRSLPADGGSEHG